MYKISLSLKPRLYDDSPFFLFSSILNNRRQFCIHGVVSVVYRKYYLSHLFLYIVKTYLEQPVLKLPPVLYNEIDPPVYGLTLSVVVVVVFRLQCSLCSGLFLTLTARDGVHV